MQQIIYRAIGIIHSPFAETTGMPIQAKAAEGVTGSVVIEPEYVAGLKDLEGFSHVIVLYHFHLSEGYSLEVKPFLDDRPHGVFATRAPKRPNSIGISVVRLTGIADGTLEICDVDVVDGTPLLDIKPYVPAFDVRQAERIGWLADNARRMNHTRADERFK